MFSQIDDEGHHFQILTKITDHNSDDNVISISYILINLINSNNLPKKTTAGWELQMEWKYRSTSWVTLKYLKASSLLELSECAINNNIECGPNFH